MHEAILELHLALGKASARAVCPALSTFFPLQGKCEVAGGKPSRENQEWLEVWKSLSSQVMLEIKELLFSVNNRRPEGPQKLGFL